MILGYWLIDKTIDRNKIIIYSDHVAHMTRKTCLGLLLGWFTIPWALFFSK